MLRLFKQYYPVRNAIFVVGEGLFILLSVIFASVMLLGAKCLYEGYNDFFLKALLITSICQMCLYFNDLYDLKVTDTYTELGIRLLQALGAAAILMAGVYFIFPGFIIGRGIFIISIAFVILFVVSWRVGYAHVLTKGFFNQRIILVGSGDLALNIVREIEERKDSGYDIAAVASRKEFDPSILFGAAQHICKEGYSGLCDIALKSGVKKVIVALEERRGIFPTGELLKCRVNGIEVLEGTSFYEMLTGKLIVKKINPAWLIFSEGFQKSWTQKLFKRIGDIIISSLMLILLSPLLIVVAIIIKLESPGPVLFSQERVGQNRKPYMVHKFRSMCDNAEKESGPVWAQEDDVRITRVGNFIRKWRIDEIPQIWNVLKGEMSFVGPRPERDHFVKDLEDEIPYYGERFTVKPGLTGWAQVSYGYGASVDDAIEKLNYDLFYIKNMSIFMDLMVIMRTVKTVIFGKGR